MSHKIDLRLGTEIIYINNRLPIMTEVTYTGSFDFVKSYDRASIENAHFAINKCELWEWLRDFDPPYGEGFMFCDTPELRRITAAMHEHNDIGHSGSSFAFVMRLMQYIATYGFAQFKVDYLREN
jgi:hypothetical protein